MRTMFPPSYPHNGFVVTQLHFAGTNEPRVINEQSKEANISGHMVISETRQA